MQYKHLPRLIGICLSTALIACQSTTEVPQTLPTKEIIAVSTYPISQGRGTIEVQATGILAAENEVKYSFKVGGVVEKIYVNEGDYVQKGKLLATLKKEEINAGYTQANLALDKARRDLERTRNLYSDSVATLEQLQNATTAYEVAARQVAAVAFNQDYTNIYAAANGYVAKKLAHEREIVGEGMPVLIVHENKDGAWVLRLGLSDKDWALVEVGSEAQVVLDAFPNQPQVGRVHRKSMAAEAGSGSLQVEVKVFCKEIAPAFGMFGKATIRTKHSHTYTAIPYGALVEADGKTGYVFVPGPQGKVSRHAIEIAAFDNDAVYVKSGLENIQQVIVSNSAFLNEQSTITIVQPTAL